MEVLNQWLEEDYHEIKEYALALIKDLIDFDSDYFTNNLESFIHTIIDHYPDDAPIWQLEDEVLEALANSQNSTRMLQILAPLILKEEPPALQALIKTMKHIISKWGEYELVPILKILTEPLITTFNHPHANVRKSVVFWLVELYFAVGESFEPWLQELNPSQQKLVWIYIQRRNEDKNLQ